MLEIYKKLPGTNCGQCGQSSCMAFALKVKKSQARLSECPCAAGETDEEGQAPSGGQSFSIYEQVGRELEREAVGTDFKEAAGAIGATYTTTDGKEAIVMKMIGAVYELRKEGLFHNNTHCGDSWAKIIICDYVRRKGTGPLTGELLPLGVFSHAPSLVKSFQSSAEKKIAAAFGKDLTGLRQRCSALGANETESGVRADYTARIDLLPKVPLYLSFWLADAEFDAACTLLFDSGAGDHVDIGYLAYLLERFAGELAAD